MNYGNMTKDKLLELLAEKDKQISGQEETIETLQAEVKSVTAKGAGWLIETPNPMYDGTNSGIQFFMGQAFINEGQTLPQFEIEPMKPGQMEKYSEAEQQAILDRIAVPSAERAAMVMENDFGYKVTYFDGSESAEAQMQKLINNRTLEYRNAAQAAEAREKALQAAGVANFMGGD